MNWMIDAVYALFLTSLTGSILFLFWNKVGKVLDQMGYLNVLYYILQINSMFFCVPVVYALLYYLDNVQGRFHGTLFLQTESIMIICQCLFVIWLCGFAVSLVKQMRAAIIAHEKFHTGNDCKAEEYQCFREVCDRLGIKNGKVALYRSYHTLVPCITGVFKPRVLLPERDYTARELEIIFLHELTHYQQRDLWIKALTMIVGCIQWFNPLVNRYGNSLELWSEFACDVKASGKAQSVNLYIKVLSEMAIAFNTKECKVVSMLYENEGDLIRRLERVKRYEKMKKKPRVQAAAVCAVLCLLSSTTVMAASVGIAEQYTALHAATAEMTEEVSQEPEVLQEYVETEVSPGIVEEIGETVSNAKGSIVIIDWTVGSNVLKKTSTFSAKAGESIAVTLSLDPADKQVRVGIIEPNGTMRYVLATGSVSHTFSLNTTGSYRVYVQNMNNVSVAAGGSYTVR